VNVARLELAEDLQHLERSLQAGYMGEMQYLADNLPLRAQPALLHPNTASVISVRMDYWQDDEDAWAVLNDPSRAYVSRYALGRDYHKLMRSRLKKLAERIHAEIAPHGFRAFADSAPILEKALARNAGLGWIGKNTLVLNQKAGSYFFLGEIYSDLPLEPTQDQAKSLCGSCTACLDVCPTKAFVAPYRLDATKCISYLTIESKDGIPPNLRPLLGNRIFGCDDCQLVCPWNRYAKISQEADFQARHGLNRAHLLDLWAWDEALFLKNTEGMALRRTGWRGWRRNLAVALGNSQDPAALVALQAANDEDEMVQDHVRWAVGRLAGAKDGDCF
jgi:epoxyqueuosine reductase